MSEKTPNAAQPATKKQPSPLMKPATAAKKLGLYLPACPDTFQAEPLSRSAFAALQSDPPAWLVQLRVTGPHPRDVVARKLGVSVSGLARAGMQDALTTAQIQDLLAAPPAWLTAERATQAGVRAENARVNARDAERRARTR